ncbi:MAG: hypothetical protein ACJ74O_06215 [Frankiaceae bacterium]
MHDPLQRLYKTKLALLATVLTGLGLAFLIAAQAIDTTEGFTWLQHWPLHDLGSALFTTGLITIAYNYLDRTDSEARATQRLERVLRAEAPAIRDAVIDGFAFNRDDLKRVTNPETLDQIIENSLALRLGDEVFAAEVYNDVRDQAIRASERWYDVRVSIDLTRTEPAAAGGVPPFVATVRWEYRVIPRYSSRRFVCTSSREEYHELAQEPAATSAWFMRPENDSDATSRAAFELVQFSVDGEERSISRSVRKTGQVYSVSLGRNLVEAGQPVTIAYTYRTLTSQHGHLLHFDIEQPSRGVDFELDYSDCGIAYVNVLDFIASSRKTRVSQTPASVPGRAVAVQFDGWVFPRSGVAFVWVLEDELSPQRVSNRR